MQTPSIEKVVFVLSAVVLAFLYGYATDRFDLTLNPFLERVVRQALVATSSSADDRPEWTAPRVYDRSGVREVQPNRSGTGPILITSVWNGDGWAPGLRLIDENGRLLHEWEFDPPEILSDSAWTPMAWNDPDIQGSYLFPNGDVLVNIEYVGTVRADACSEVKWRLREGGHHSVARANDGTFWIPGMSGRRSTGDRDASPPLPGVDGSVYRDRLMRVTPAGRVIEDIDLLAVIYQSGLARHIHKSGKATSNDITHLNDIDPLPDSLADEYPLFEAGDLAVSLKGLDMVLVMDPASRTVKWHASEPFIKQHDPDFTGDGWIGVFDNNEDGTERGTALGGSRIVRVQPHTDSVEVVFPTGRSDPFYTRYRGKWQLLENGNMLLTESTAGRVVEVASDGSTVWEWVAEPYSATAVPEVSKAVRVDLTEEEVAEWPCAPADTEPEVDR